MLKLKNKCRILESGKEKYEITYKLAADFSEKKIKMDSMEWWILNCEESNCQPRLLYQLSHSFKEKKK